jgi:hypothetical protein
VGNTVASILCSAESVLCSFLCVAADGGAAVTHGFYACVICVKKKNLYPSVKAIQKVRACCFCCG